MGSFISQRLGQFDFWDTVLDRPDWSGKRVLDFGGNVGNVLLDPDCRIEPKYFWSLDVSRDAISEGQRRHPDAHFVFYDRYHCEYNPTGVPKLPIPDMGTTFDFILTRSVVTHMSQAQTLEIVTDLFGWVAPGGLQAITFMDPYWAPPPGWARPSESPERSNLRWRLDVGKRKDPSVDVEALAEVADRSGAPWVTVVNEGELILDPDQAEVAENQPHRQYVAMCTTDYMLKILPGARIRPPNPPDRLHCAIINKD